MLIIQQCAFPDMPEEPNKKESPIGLIVFLLGLGIFFYYAGGNLEKISEMKGWLLLIGIAALGFHYGYGKIKERE
jgi:hypothetical protein